MTLEEWVNSKYNTYGYKFSFIKMKNFDVLHVNEVFIKKNGNYEVADLGLYIVINTILDIDDSSVDLDLFSLKIYRENVDTLNNEISSQLYNTEYIKNEILPSELGIDASSYEVSPSFTLIDYYGNSDTSSFNFPLKVSFTMTESKECQIIQYQSQMGIWDLLPVESYGDNYIFNIQQYSYNDPFIAICK